MPIDTEINVCFGNSSVDMFDIPGVEKTTGLSKADAEAYPETPEDAYIFAMVNTDASGKPFIFFNFTRLLGEIEKNGDLSLLNLLGHEMIHLVRLIQAQGKLGGKFDVLEWPTIGGDITEADTAELQGVVLEKVGGVVIELLKIAEDGEST